MRRLRVQNCLVPDDSLPEPAPADVTSFAAHWYSRAQARAARDGGPPELIADIATLGELSQQIEALRAEIAADPEADRDADGLALVARLERGARLLDLNADSANVTARVAGEPEAADLWLVIAGAHREHAAQTRRAAALIADAEIT